MVFFFLFVIFGISFFGIFDGGGFPIVGSFSWIFLDFFRDDSRILLLINFSGISRKNATCLKITVIVSLDLSWFIFRRERRLVFSFCFPILTDSLVKNLRYSQ